MKSVRFVLFSTAALLFAGLPGGAWANQPGSSIRDYVRARAADADGRIDVAARGYGALLARNPNDPVIATRAYRQAISAGDRSLAMAAAVQLDRAGNLPPDARLLILADAVARRDWTAAQAATDAIVREKAFAFLVPAIRAWIAVGSKTGDPVAILDAGGTGSVTGAYAGEQRALLLLATGRTADGIAALRAILPAASGRQMRLRLAAAALLARQGKRGQAAAILDGDAPTLVKARADLKRRGTLPAPIDTPAAGIAELLVRVAIDINRERATPIALALARTATFLAPDNAETWLVTSELLLTGERYAAATEALTHVRDDDPFAAAAAEGRLSAMVRSGESEAALAAAQAAAARSDAGPGDWSRVGDVLASLGRSREAAEAYGKAAALAPADARWPAWLLQGSALEEAGDWAAAKPVLEKAYAAAPDEAVVLNLLGYAQLERRENLAAAQALIERASLLRPDDASITDSLGWAYYLRGDVPRAIATLERAVAGDPAQSAINEHLGDAYWSAGRRFEARYAWSAALVGAEPADLLRLRAKIDGGWTKAVAAP
ncbi:tetratricopeptide repeat protein [Sphingomonas prati]|uniref:Tetratricopeptide (TPR) repeat protein n=1 Tax=Sphingomonas prati TaxID=1843237 RepID=A0A7W9F0A7_9SPHN|nr:tetratricopeptide repeat protein [Sphingomonas prati]MBB5728177.1 tetratricopeptide (TPR) repeat protein [Sphingomonas prati]